MDENDLRARIEDVLLNEFLYRGTQGRKRFVDFLPDGISLHEIVPRLVNMVAGPYRDKAAVLEGKNRISAAERRVLSRKVNQIVDVVVMEDLSLVEVREILRLKGDGLTVAKIASLFDMPTAMVKTVIETMDGKHEERVIYNAEMRRRRKLTLQRPSSQVREIDIETDTESTPVRAVRGH